MGRATRDAIVIVGPPAEPLDDNSNGRIDVGAKFARPFLISLQNIVGMNVEHAELDSYQEYKIPVDVIATRDDFAADRNVGVPSRVSIGMSLPMRYAGESQTSIRLDKPHHLRPVGEYKFKVPSNIPTAQKVLVAAKMTPGEGR